MSQATPARRPPSPPVSRSPALVAISALVTLVVAAPGCLTNNRALSSASTNGKALSTTLSAVPVSSGDGSITALTRVLKSSDKPLENFDLIGDGSGSLGQYCTAISGGAAGATTCKCAYAWTTTAGASESDEADTVYSEANLIRCPYTRVPAGITTVKVRIHLVPSATYSNELTYRFGADGSTADFSLTTSFAQVKRYQCRDIVTVRYLLDPAAIYDPIQSEDPTVSYPLNYYSTNFGGTFASYSGNNVDSWYCPPIPNDPAAGLSPTIYSIAPDSSGSKLIYPPAGSAFDRSTFYLSKTQSGVFSIPVNAYVAPRLPSSLNPTAGMPKSLGFGASPISAGAGQEVCPDSTVTIPNGYHWAKLWLFRADLARRTYVKSPTIQSVQSISCNPGKYVSTNTAIFSDCNKAGSGAGVGGRTIADGLADRILFTNMCVRLKADATAPAPWDVFLPCGAGRDGPGCTTNGAGTAQAGGFANFGKGTDVWQPLQATKVCGAAGTLDYLGLCEPTAAPVNVPHDTAPVSANIDSGARYDFLFVVTPPTVMFSQMADSSSAISQVYTPRRYRAATDCVSNDPENPGTPGDCSAAARIGPYGLKIHDVGGGGDPPATDPSRTGVFPTCVLQPN